MVQGEPRNATASYAPQSLYGHHNGNRRFAVSKLSVTMARALKLLSPACNTSCTLDDRPMQFAGATMLPGSPVSLVALSRAGGVVATPFRRPQADVGAGSSLRSVLPAFVCRRMWVSGQGCTARLHTTACGPSRGTSEKTSGSLHKKSSGDCEIHEFLTHVCLPVATLQSAPVSLFPARPSVGSSCSLALFPFSFFIFHF